MKKWILKSNAWYDKIKEPWRFLLIIVLASPMIGLSSDNATWSIICALWLMLLVGWRMAGYVINQCKGYDF